MRVVVALGGNALLRRDAPMTVQNQRDSIAAACNGLGPLLHGHELVISHGNGPQVGLLALQAAAYDDLSSYPFDVLGAQTEGMIGYLIEQELRNVLPDGRPVVTVVTLTQVDPDDPAFAEPEKFVGPVYTESEADELARLRGWAVRVDGRYWRRVVPSPRPMRIVELMPIEWLIEKGAVVICAGGGGIPTVQDQATGRLTGVEAVIDKDRTSAVLARDLKADLLIIATDVDGVFEDWRTPRQRLLASAHPDELDPALFAAGSMGPKVAAAVEFALDTDGDAVIGSLDSIGSMLRHTAGTWISRRSSGRSYR
ncbi:carbamate kinase [Microlunatus panaciterrae]|uniref:Carbamate kinase n=1 Tax=Microlunatus panaciterrae TaxID=400768 RepID=A0ABS2RFB6_9ACTN|nr:carbamate kinase [Microlunatus panaciterrae]MBM7797695.1 carbamate kinase [Microlunatus panaciterrae]